MTDKSSFSAEEWNELLAATMLAGMVVIAADPSGIVGMLKESMANAGALADAQRNADTNVLIKSIVADFQTSEGRTAAREKIRQTLAGATSPQDAQTKSLAALKSVAALLEEKAPEDAPLVKSWLQSIGNRTAQAANEGGFLGFGGVAVSDAEQAALDQLTAALAKPATS